MSWVKEMAYRLKRPYHFWATGIAGGFLSQLRYGFPEKKLKIIAVTGTDGKTTTATLIYKLLQSAGARAALVSTVAAYIGAEKVDTGFHVTSPHPRALYKFLAKMRKKKIEYLVLEVTSQGAYQYRIWGIKPVITAITNIDQDHFDYHLNYQNYLKAKALVAKAGAQVVVNEEMPGLTTLKRAVGEKTKVATFSKNTRFSAVLEKAVRTKFKEDYNRLNAYLALTLIKRLGFAEKDLVVGLNNFVLPEGRMELVPNNLGFNLMVDFAHTPQGIQVVLTAMRKNYTKKGKLLVAIYGSAGLRDRSKRPKMGALGVALADRVIFTSEDPRTENIWSIINQLKVEIAPYHHKVISIPNREEALTYALKRYGKNGNTIVILGKGHEQSMNCDGKTETPWNDAAAAKKLIAKLERAQVSAG